MILIGHGVIYFSEQNPAGEPLLSQPKHYHGQIQRHHRKSWKTELLTGEIAKGLSFTDCPKSIPMFSKRSH